LNFLIVNLSNKLWWWVEFIPG